MKKLKIGRYVVTVSNESFLLFPQSGITKGEFVGYYHRIAPIMLPYMKNRPISMLRFPNGIDQEGFYQKEAGSYFPAWIKRKPIKKQEDGYVNYVVCNNAATLVYLANQACITPHLWLSKIDKLNYPDRLIFDLDPAGKGFAQVCDIAIQLKALLEKINVTSFVMTTGSRGLHVLIPLKRVHTFDWVRSFAYDVAGILVKRNPKRLTLEIRKDKRRGRIFVDTLRNAFGQTAVAPYAVRPKPYAPVATPLRWDEVINKRITTSQQYTIKTIFKRLAAIEDPWQNIDRVANSLIKARVLLDTLKNNDF